MLSLAATRCTPPVVAQLRDVLGTHPGTTEVHLRLLNRTESTLMRLDDGLRVTPTPALFADLKALLGTGLSRKLTALQVCRVLRIGGMSGFRLPTSASTRYGWPE